jgi:hypothetical protein
MNVKYKETARGGGLAVNIIVFVFKRCQGPSLLTRRKVPETSLGHT